VFLTRQNTLAPCLCSGQAPVHSALRPARSGRVTWDAGPGCGVSLPPVSSSPCAADLRGWACTRMPGLSLSKGCPRGAGSPGRWLVCELAGWPASLGRSGGKPPRWRGHGAMRDLGSRAPLHVREGFNVAAPHQAFRLPESGSTAEVKG